MPPLAYSCHSHLLTEVPGRTLEPRHTAAQDAQVLWLCPNADGPRPRHREILPQA